MMARRSHITTHLDDPVFPGLSLQLGGWLDGRRTYLRIGDEQDRCLGTLSGHKLYRLARAIVRQFEAQREDGAA